MKKTISELLELYEGTKEVIADLELELEQHKKDLKELEQSINEYNRRSKK